MRRLLTLACAVVFLDVTFFSVLTPLLPSFKADHHLTEGAAGVLAGSFAAGALAMAIPAGWLAARIGAKRTTIAGLVGIGIFSPIFGFGEHMALLDTARFFQGASGAMMWAGATSWVINTAPDERRGEMIGTIMAAAVVGELLGAPIGAIAHQIGTEPVFGSVIFLAAGLIAVALTVPEAEAEVEQTLREAAPLIRRSRMPRAILMMTAPSMAFGLIVVVAPLRMDELGASAFLIAAAFAAGSVVEAILGPVIGRVSDRVGRIGPYLIGATVIAFAVVVLGAVDALPAMFAAVVLVAFGAGLAFTPASTFLSESATRAGVNQGYASGSSNLAWGGGQMVGAIAGGAIAGAAGFLIPCLLIALALIGGTMVARPMGRVDGETATEGSGA